MVRFGAQTGFRMERVLCLMSCGGKLWSRHRIELGISICWLTLIQSSMLSFMRMLRRVKLRETLVLYICHKTDPDVHDSFVVALPSYCFYWFASLEILNKRRWCRQSKSRLSLHRHRLIEKFLNCSAWIVPKDVLG